MYSLSKDLTDRLIRAEELQDRYFPSDEICEFLHTKTAILLVAPTSMGKSVIMETAAALEPKTFGTAGTFTNRPSRLDDSGRQYEYIPLTPVATSNILDAIDRQELVQYAVHPTTKYICGSRISHYKSENNMLDMLSNGVKAFTKLPFKKVVVCSIVTEPKLWEKWFEARFETATSDERRKRLDEAIESLEWSLRNTGSLSWVFNKPGDLAAAAREIIDITTGSKPEKADLSDLAKKLIEKARLLKNMAANK